MPSLAGQHPRGYSKEETFESIGPFFRAEDNRIIIGQYIVHNGVRMSAINPQNAAAHKTGHALDHLLGSSSQSYQFIEAYEQDRKACSPAVREQLK